MILNKRQSIPLWGLFSIFTSLLIAGCSNAINEIDFCGRFVADGLEEYKIIRFAQDKGIDGGIPKRDKLKGEKDGDFKFKSNECGLIFNKRNGRYEYKECVNRNEYLIIRERVNKYCNYIKNTSN